MKTLLKVGAMVVIAGMFGSCGIPMATLRSVGAIPKTAGNAVNEVSGIANTLYGGL